MSRPADGGSGGGGTYVVDHAALTAVASGLGSAGEAMDSVGGAVPATGDLGEAGPLLSAVLARVTEVGGRLAYEASVLSATVTECHQAATGTDQAIAESYLVTGRTPGGTTGG